MIYFVIYYVRVTRLIFHLQSDLFKSNQSVYRDQSVADRIQIKITLSKLKELPLSGALLLKKPNVGRESNKENYCRIRDNWYTVSFTLCLIYLQSNSWKTCLLSPSFIKRRLVRKLLGTYCKLTCNWCHLLCHCIFK